MGKLAIDCLNRPKNLTEIAKAVYDTLSQVDNLKAEIIYMNESDMQALNKETRGIDKVTDVLSYPSLDGIRGKILFPEDCVTELEGKYIFIGSIVLCEEKIRSQAKEYGNTYEQEREYLIIHGLLHLMGYDHMTDEDKTEMRALEKQILSVLHDKKGKTK
jgi:probable rRNA maturation factor